ncbi:cell division ATP-binding protein FtsE [Alkalibacter rhizosphaerae]|uniref:Cell division ATP-binding protein FtsE n=1 Tax=Alkalibacter rhizosphaerae TaxID=2815577 RepID=A0A974XE25_9FIRM|nr:cell division ATP-binding protein FtsE [Alkalibacter rhizosphaerae]QSX08128.1 cell division ATP-binding protein FtsE [Alkalibacter rhizosphaerae]
MIRFENINKIYDKTQHLALSDITLEIAHGDFVFVVGKSGAGKSTLIKMILKELDPTEGKIYIENRDITRLKKRHIPMYRRQLGVVFQDYRLLSDKTVYENVAYAMEIVENKTKDIQEKVPEVLQLVGLGHRMRYYPDQLSGGEQQRVSIARAIVNDPKIIICDEPTGNLDPRTSLGIMKLLHSINGRGTTIIMATHDRDIVDMMQARVITLHGGRVVSDKKGGYDNEDSYL